MSEDGGDDTPPRPKRKIKKVMIVSSSSESDSDESVGVVGTRRKRLRVVSDEEASDSSGSSVVQVGIRRRRTLPKLRDSDGESDVSGWASDTSNGRKPASIKARPVSGFASDSSEGNSDKCSICLLRFTNQETGTPENCEHIFCFDCITEWSKNVNTCPVDRITFNSITVRACAGGRVLRSESVKVAERRPSVEMLVIEDLTICEICGSSQHEETMLLCDGCDMGYHMECLTPPLSEIPVDQWLCPSCDDLLEDVIHLSEVEDLFTGFANLPLGPNSSPLRETRHVRRSTRNAISNDQPSTSTGRRGNSRALDLPTTSQPQNSRRTNASSTSRQRTTTTQRRKRKRRKTKTIVIEYEVQENGKFPITRRVTKKIRKRKTKRQPRTAARRTHVRASVRAKLATLQTDQRLEVAQSLGASGGVQELAVRRLRAGIPSLSLMGNPNQLDFFSDDENDVSEAATTAVATRPTSNILSAYRQARRKMIAIPSPTHASSAPDILSNILESQTLLHSKKSLMSVTLDGNITIKLQTKGEEKNKSVLKKQEKLDLTKADDSTKKAPTYPGQSRGGGGWGGGYRGNYHREQGSNNNFNRGGNYEQNNYSGGYQSRQGNMLNNFQNNNTRRDEPESNVYFDNYSRRPQFPNNDESYLDRPRRAGPMDNNRGPNFQNFQRISNDQNQGRHSLGMSWPTYSGGNSGPRYEAPAVQSRHSFGGFENPVDMRMSHVPPMNMSNTNSDSFTNVEAPRQDKRQPLTFQSLPESQPYQPLSQPPIFNFPKISDVEKSEDERSDSGLVIDTEKYDPTEPTNDDESGDDEKEVTVPMSFPTPTTATLPPLPADTLPPLPAPPPIVQSILAGIDTTAMNVPPNILDSAVRQVLKEHRNLISSPNAESHNNKSDEDSDGDCPNFSIYSATSVHIANNTSSITDDIAKEHSNEDNLEDLVQEDDDVNSDGAIEIPVVEPPIEKKIDANKNTSKVSYNDSNPKKKSEEEYKEKVSKRCPITTNTRNPIKIKLNTPSLIKRQVSLYDEEETSQDAEEVEVPGDMREEKPEESYQNNSNNEKSDQQDVNEDNDKKKSDTKCMSQFRDTFSKESPDVINEPNSNEVNDIKNKNLSDEEDEKLKESNIHNEKEEDPISDDCTKSDKSIEEPKVDLVIENDVESNNESHSTSQSPKEEIDQEKIEENIEKMTESISETEDERSYTPCLDENKSNKDASFEIDKEMGIEGLDTEMISEEEGNEMFSENERVPSEASRASAIRAVALESEEGEIPDKKKERKKSETREEGSKKKKKKESKKEGKDKSKNKKKAEISFKKLSKSGKERNYRERDKDDKKGDRDRRGSGDAESRQKKRKEKRKDLERYDVRTIVTEKRRKLKDPFGRDVSPRGRSPSFSRSSPAHSPSPARRSSLPRRRSPSLRRSPSAPRRSLSKNRRSLSKVRRSFSRGRRSISRVRRSPSRGRRSLSRIRKSLSRGRKSPSRIRRSPSGPRRSISRGRRSPVRKSAPRAARARSASRGRPSPIRGRRLTASPRVSPRRRASSVRRKRRRSATSSPPRRVTKKKKRARSPARRGAGVRRRSNARAASPAAVARPPSPRTPPEPEPLHVEPEIRERRRRDPDRLRRRPRDALPPSKEVFTSGDNILVSVSFKDQERGEEGERRKKRETRRERRKRKRAAPTETENTKPVAIIDLDRSPFRELTPSPKNVIVLSDSDHGEKEGPEATVPPPVVVEPTPDPAPALGPKTPPEPTADVAVAEGASGTQSVAAEVTANASEAGSPDAYDPFEPTRSPSASPGGGQPSPPRQMLTLEAAQRSNLSADEVLDRRPLSPAEKVLALLQSQRAASPEPPPTAPEVAPVAPSPTRTLPKLFPGKPSPIKSNPVKPMQAMRLARPPSDGGASPYSPGSSDFGELFEPPPRRMRTIAPAKLPGRMHKKKGKTQVGIKIDEENLKILDELPSSAVEMQVKSKFLKKLNRQERVVEEVKLVLKPHYNKKRVTKDEYKEILRRCVPKICHNKTGEINPTKIQALVEAYVKKFRKKHKLGIV